MRIGLLGSLQVDGADVVMSPRDRVVLAALALRAGEVVTAEQLADARWPGEPPVSWPKLVQGCVMRLRRAVGPQTIETSGRGYRLAVAAEDIDARRFESLVERAGEHRVTGSPERAASTLAQALSLWRGAPYEDLDAWPPGWTEAARLDELRLTAEEDLLDTRLAIGQHRGVAADGTALVTAEPLRERRWAILALAQYRCGRQAAALQSLQRARRMLVEHLGIDPGPDLVALETAILRQDEALAAPREPPQAVGDQCPYKGLAPYDAADSYRFFGRDADVAACLKRLEASPLLVVAGPSGCGKSSLLRAGLAPVFERRGQPVVSLVPEPDPRRSLANALAATADRAVLVVDQLEELFTLDGTAEQAAAFCSELVAYARHDGPVVVAVRADHLAGLTVEPTFARLAEEGLYLVSPLTGEALRAAIDEPAAQAGLHLEEGLVDLLVRDAEGEPGALPLLSHALAQTWQHRDGRILTVEGYRATGGIRGAVARSADRLYESLAPEERTVLRSVVLRLVTPSPDGEPVRSRVPARSFVGDAARERIIRLLVKARLVTTAEHAVELAHEALARAWPRLRSWLDDDAAGQRVLRHLSAAADGWESLGQPDSELYRGARLETAREWRDTNRPDLTRLETEFLDASVARAASEQEAMADQARQQARQNRRLRSLLGATAALLVASFIAASLAVDSGREARRHRDGARAAKEDAELEALVNRSLALRSTDRAVAALLAVEAHRRAPGDARAHSALLGTFTDAPGFMGYRHLPVDSLPLPGAVIPSTSTAVVALDGRDLRLLDLDSGVLHERFPPLDPAVVPMAPTFSTVRVSPDGRYAAHLVPTEAPQPCFAPDVLRDTDDAGCAALLVYHVASGQRVLGPVTPPFGPGDVALNADGSLVAVAGGYDGKVAVYRTADGEQLGVLDGVRRPAGIDIARHTATVAFGADGRLYTGSIAGPVRVVEPSAMEVVDAYDAPAMGTHNNLVVTGDGLVVGTGEEHLVALDTETGVVSWAADIVVPDDITPCAFMAVAERAGRVYCGNVWGVLDERELATGERTGVRFDPQLGSVGDLAIAADGRELVAFGADAAVVTRWRLDGTGPVVERFHPGWGSNGYNPSGELMMVFRGERTTLQDHLADDPLDFAVWDPAADQIVDDLDDVIGGVWATPELLGVAYRDGSTGYYDVRRHTVVEGLADEGEIGGAWLRAGRMYLGYALSDDDGPRCEIRSTDLDTLQRTDLRIEFDDCDVSFLASFFVSATSDGSRVGVTYPGPAGWATVVYDGGSGEPLGEPLLGAYTTSFGPDGTLVAANLRGEIALHDPDTLEPVGAFPGVRGAADWLDFSADGSLLLVGSSNQNMSIYDVATRTRLGDPIGSDLPLVAGNAGPALRPDGKAVAVNSRDGLAVWNIDPDHLASAACRLAGRNLTQGEWDTYLGAMGAYRATCPE